MVATVLFAGHESESWTGTPNVGATVSAGDFDADYSRCASIIGITPVQWGLPSFGNLAEVWLHTRWSTFFGIQVAINKSIMEFKNSASQGILRLFYIGTTAQLQYWSGAAWVQIGATFTPSLANQTIDIACKIHSTTGWFAIWLDGTKVVELVGNTNFFAATVDQIWLCGFNSFNGSAMSEIIAANGETLSMRCATLGVTGAGTTNTMASGTFVDVDEIGASNDADFTQANAAGQLATYALGNLSVAAQALTPVAVCVNLRARNSAVVPQNLQAALRSASINYFSSTFPTPTTSFQSGYGYVWSTDPATAAPWTISGINAAEGGEKAIT